MTLDEELQLIPALTNIGRALIQFTTSLSAGEFVCSKRRTWSFTPANFVAITVHYARAKTFTLSLHGNWKEFDEKKILPLRSGRNSMYSECVITSPRQLAAASAYIERAYYLQSNSKRHEWKYEAV